MDALTIAGWLLVGFLLLNACLTVLLIGKPRNPITPGLALTVTVLNALMAAIVVALILRAH